MNSDSLLISDFKVADQVACPERIVTNISALLSSKARLGGDQDLQMEPDLRRLWGLSGDDGAYIHSEFRDVPESQALRDLFPEGVPARAAGGHDLDELKWLVPTEP